MLGRRHIDQMQQLVKYFGPDADIVVPMLTTLMHATDQAFNHDAQKTHNLTQWTSPSVNDIKVWNNPTFASYLPYIQNHYWDRAWISCEYKETELGLVLRKIMPIVTATDDLEFLYDPTLKVGKDISLEEIDFLTDLNNSRWNKSGTTMNLLKSNSFFQLCSPEAMILFQHVKVQVENTWSDTYSNAWANRIYGTILNVKISGNFANLVEVALHYKLRS